MLRCLPSRSSLLRNVSVLLPRCGRRAGFHSQFSTTSTRRETRNDAIDIDINIETDLDHSRTTDPSASEPEPILHPALPLPSNPDHHDLPTFLAHTRRTGVSTSSTVYRGTLYEYLAAQSLRRYGFELVRVGRAGDQGIDLVGFWKIPAAHTGKDTTGDGPGMQTLRVLVQCKRISRTAKARPNLMRELEGAVRGPNVPVGWRGPGVMGILVAERGATKGVRDAMAGARRAMGWVMLECDDAESEIMEDSRALMGREHVGTVRQILWNKAASNLGLEGLGVVTRYVADAGKESGGGDAMNQEAVLMWEGKMYPELESHSLKT